MLMRYDYECGMLAGNANADASYHDADPDAT